MRFWDRFEIHLGGFSGNVWEVSEGLLDILKCHERMLSRRCGFGQARYVAQKFKWKPPTGFVHSFPQLLVHDNLFSVCILQLSYGSFRDICFGTFVSWQLFRDICFVTFVS